MKRIEPYQIESSEFEPFDFGEFRDIYHLIPRSHLQSRVLEFSWTSMNVVEQTYETH